MVLRKSAGETRDEAHLAIPGGPLRILGATLQGARTTDEEA